MGNLITKIGIFYKSLRIKFFKDSKAAFVARTAKLIGKRNISIGAHSVILDYSILHCGPWARTGLFESRRPNERLIIGSNCSIQPFVIINTGGGKIEMGDNCSINPFSVIYGAGGLSIGNNVSIATGVTILPQSHRVTSGLGPSFGTGTVLQPIIIEDNVWLGANVTILGGITIGKGAIVAAGAVVNKDVPQGSFVGGVPAKVLKYREGVEPISD